MPEYDFYCQKCKDHFSCFFSYDEYEKAEVRCPACGKDTVQRIIKRVLYSRSSESRLDNFADFSDAAAMSELEKDPRALGGMMRRMSNEIGEEMGPEFNEVVNRLEKGQSSEEIEKALPDLGSLEEV